MEQREPSYTVDGNINWHYIAPIEKNTEIPQSTKSGELLYDPEIPHLGIYPEKISLNLKRYK